MKHYTQKIIFFVLSVVTALSPIASDARSAADFFVDAPQGVFPLLDRNTRLDMVDYFNSHLDTPSANMLDGKSRIADLSPLSVAIEMSAASDYQLFLLESRNDTIIGVITTIKAPAADSRIDFYNKQWERLDASTYFAKPSLDDWLTPDGKKNKADVQAFVPFALISYTYSPSANNLTLTNNTKQFFSPDIYEIVGGFLLPEKVYEWNGRNFKLVK